MTKSNVQTTTSWPIIGNNHVFDFLSQSLSKQAIASSYIFLGPEGLGKTTAAKFFVKSLLCQTGGTTPCETCSSCEQMEKTGGEDSLSSIHSDYHLIRKDLDEKNISIEKIRDFNQILNMSSFLNSYKTGIIKDAESLSLHAANALLKTLEEPKKKVVIILIASGLENIPATVASRSQVLNFYPVKKDLIYDHLIEKFNTSRSVAKNIAHLSLGRGALAIKFLEDQEFLLKYQERAEIFLDFLLESDLNVRINRLHDFLGTKDLGPREVDKALAVLEGWRGVARDIILINSSNQDLIQYEILKEKLNLVARKFDFLKSVKLIGLIQTGEKQIRENVSPRLVLENILFNF